MKSLVDRKQAFSAGALWVALGPKLMGSKATIRAQVAQMEKEKASVSEIATKKANDLRVKVEKADASFQLFKSGKKMSLEAWRDIVRFLVPLYDKKTAPSKLGSIVKMKDKLDSFEADFGSSWNELMEIQLKQFQSKPLSEPNAQVAESSLRAQLHLDSDSDGGADEDGDEAGV